MKSLLVGSTSGRCLVLHPLPGCLLLGVRVMPVVHPLSLEGTAGPEPGILLLGTLGLVAPVLGPLDVRGLAQDAGLDEGPNVHPDAVVEVRVPADRLFRERLPHLLAIWPRFP